MESIICPTSFPAEKIHVEYVFRHPRARPTDKAVSSRVKLCIWFEQEGAYLNSRPSLYFSHLVVSPHINQHPVTLHLLNLSGYTIWADVTSDNNQRLISKNGPIATLSHNIPLGIHLGTFSTNELLTISIMPISLLKEWVRFHIVPNVYRDSHVPKVLGAI